MSNTILEKLDPILGTLSTYKNKLNKKKLKDLIESKNI